MAPKQSLEKIAALSGEHLIERASKEGWTYLKSVVDIMREPVLLLDENLRVLAANEPFYQTFQAERSDTEGKSIYELGNGQWDILALRKLMDDVLPKKTFFKGFEVIHDFPVIGRKSMLLSARQIYVAPRADSKAAPDIILVTIEDITEIMVIAETLAGRANQVEERFAERTHKLELQIKDMEERVRSIKIRR
jgi:PAS domain-containing protein